MSETTLLATASNIVYDDLTFSASGNNNNNSSPQQEQQRAPDGSMMLTLNSQTSDVFSNPTFPSSRLSIPNTYIPSLASLPGTSTVVAATTSENEHENGVWTVDLTNARLVQRYPCPANGADPATNTITALKAGVDGRTFLTTSRDRAFRLWDVRAAPSSESSFLQITAPRPLLSFDIDGSFLATGTESNSSGASIIFWDTRNPRTPLYQHESTHSDDITTLRFKPTSAPSSNEHAILLSASTDGLICLSNAREQDEDEAGLHVGNWGKSVSRCDWMQDGSGVWSASDMETFATWDGELNPTYDFGDLRTPSIQDTWESNYIIDASWYSASSRLTASSSDFLGIWMGNNNGDFALFNPTSPHSMQVERVFRSNQTLGHSGIVRSVLYHKESRCIITGGEDSLIHIWPSSSNNSTTPTPTASAIINKRLASLDDEGDIMMGTPTPPTSPRRMDDGFLPPPTSTKGKKRKTDDGTLSGDKKRGKQGF
ncbi:hypothetical protein FRC04_001893 [Tulasnella sp. 424]|nr:hypothetical protein FRC04_001893 [Tulasnella sp. 424]KAG8977672.1 hypothetical protein FRC05_000928 [Tulasnella sp. 425]